MRSRREFIQLASVSAMLLATNSWSSVAAKQKLKTSVQNHNKLKLVVGTSIPTIVDEIFQNRVYLVS